MINSRPHSVPTFRQNFDELNNQGFDFTNGLNCSDVHLFGKLNNLSISKLELGFYQEENIWKQKFLFIEISKNESDRVVDLLIYENQYVLIKKIHITLVDYICKFVCRRCSSFYRNKHVLKKEKQRYKHQNKTGIRTTIEFYKF